MTLYTEGNYLSDVLKYENPDMYYSREEVTVLAGSGSARTLPVGTVIGKATKAATVTASGVTGTGNGVITAGATGTKAIVGVYKATCTAAASNAGTFEIETPTGQQLQQEVTVGGGATNVDDHFTITIADGATDFIVGDTFTITVAEGTNKVVALTLAAVNGTQEAYGVIGTNAVAPDGTDLKTFAIVRDAIVSLDGLLWPDSITNAQKAKALAELSAKGIIARDGV